MISKRLKSSVESEPRINGDELELTKTEIWFVTKINLLQQKEIIEQEFQQKKKQLERVNYLLSLFM